MKPKPPGTIIGPIIMDQRTAAEFGIDVDSLNAGAPSVQVPPVMTEENAHLFNSAGEYDPLRPSPATVECGCPIPEPASGEA